MKSTHSALLTPEEAAKALRVHRTTVYRLIEAGELKASRVGGQWRIAETSLAKFLNLPDGKVAL